MPKTIIADAAYGNEENYVYLKEKQIPGIVQDRTYHKEKSWAWKQDISKVGNWDYNEEEYWTCAGRAEAYLPVREPHAHRERL
nr:hypothetical protein [Paenibacillus zanthoxyli]